MTSYNIEEVFEQPMKVCSQNDITFGEEIRPNQNFTNFQTDNSKENQYRLNSQGFRSDNDYLDKTMSFLGNSMNYIKKIKPFLGK